MSITVHKGDVNEDGSAVLLNRICVETGSTTPITGEGYPIVQSQISAIIYSIFDTSKAADETGYKVADAVSLTVSAVVYDTLQDAAGVIWTEDSTGYNFRHLLAAASFPNGHRTYRYEAKVTLTSGVVFWVLWDLAATEVRTS